MRYGSRNIAPQHPHGLVALETNTPSVLTQTSTFTQPYTPCTGGHPPVHLSASKDEQAAGESEKESSQSDSSIDRVVQQPSIYDLDMAQLAQEIRQVEQREGILHQFIARQQTAIDQHEPADAAGLKYARYKKEQLETALQLQNQRKKELENLYVEQGWRRLGN